MASAEEYANWIVANEAKKGTPEFETVAQAYQVAKGQAAAPPTPPKPEALGDKIPQVGAYEGAMSLASGAVAAPVAGLAGLASTVIPGVKSGDVVNKVQEALTYQPRSEVGKTVAETVSAPFAWLASKADQAGAATTDATGSPLLGAAVNTGIQALPMVVGGVGKVAPESAAAIAKRAEAKALNAPRDAGLVAAKEAGLKVPPSQAGGSAAMQTIEGFAGEPRTAKLASQKNAPVLTNLIRKDLGLPDDVPLSREALANIRKSAGQAYEAVKGVGEIRPDAQYFADFKEITKSFDTAAKDFQHRSDNPFKKTVDGLTTNTDGVSPKTKFDAASLVEEVKLLRADADSAYANRQPGLGKAFKSAAQALDDMLDRHVQTLAQTDPKMAGVVKDYQAARVQVAKSYAADKALNDANGMIDASVYAKELKKGRPLTGEAETVAKFAAQFPRSAQRVEKSNSGALPSIFDAALAGAGAGAGSGSPSIAAGAALAAAAARPLARQVVTMRSPSAPTYEASVLRRLLDEYGSTVPMAGAGTANGSLERLLESQRRQR